MYIILYLSLTITELVRSRQLYLRFAPELGISISKYLEILKL